MADDTTVRQLATDWFLNGNMTVAASSIAWQLATTATTPEDRYKAARGLARCSMASKSPLAVRGDDAKLAVKALELAEAVGFRDVELLKGQEWNSCRELPEFQKVLKSIATAKPLAPSPRPVPQTR